MGGLAQWLASRTPDQGVPGSRLDRGTVCCGLEQVTFTHCLVLIKPRKPWTERHIRTDCDEAGDYGVPNVLSPRDLVSRPTWKKLYYHQVECITFYFRYILIVVYNISPTTSYLFAYIIFS